MFKGSSNLDKLSGNTGCNIIITIGLQTVNLVIFQSFCKSVILVKIIVDFKIFKAVLK